MSIILATAEDVAVVSTAEQTDASNIAIIQAQLAALGAALAPNTPAPAISGLLYPNRVPLADYSFGTAAKVQTLAALEAAFDWKYPNGDTTLSGNQECETYQPFTAGLHVLGLNSLKLTAQVAPGKTIVGTTAFNVADRGSIVSAMIATLATYRYGYFEARVKMPPAAAKGAFPAFWCTVGAPVAGHTAWWPPETDFFEVSNNSGSATVDDGTGNPFFGMFSGTQVLSKLTNQWNSYHPTPPADLGATFATFGCEWLPDPRGDRWRRYIMIDGQPPVLVNDMIYPWVYSDGTPAAPAHVYLNLAYGGTWAGRNGIDPTQLPCALEVEHFRIYA